MEVEWEAYSLVAFRGRAAAVTAQTSPGLFGHCVLTVQMGQLLIGFVSLYLSSPVP